MSKTETLPEKIFRDSFNHFSSKNIFNLGETSKRMQFIVLNNVTHPFSTELQYRKTIKKTFEKLTSPYDNISTFLILIYAQRKSVNISSII